MEPISAKKATETHRDSTVLETGDLLIHSKEDIEWAAYDGNQSINITKCGCIQKVMRKCNEDKNCHCDPIPDDFMGSLHVLQSRQRFHLHNCHQKH